MNPSTMHYVAAGLFALALIHTFAAKSIEKLSLRHPRHGGLFHLLGEVEVVFGFWAAILIVAMALIAGGESALSYAESRNYTEPLFVFVVMVVAASRPILMAMMQAVDLMARVLPMRDTTARVWLGLALVPLAGSFITEPAAMTIAALMLRAQVFRAGVPERLKYAALGVLFVNISVGGTLTSYAAPPVLMVAQAWGWDTAFMAATFGWKAAIAVLINASAVTYVLREYVNAAPSVVVQGRERPPVPVLVTAVHVSFLAAVVVFAHHPIVFLALFLFFIGYTQAYSAAQNPLIIKEALLVGFFLAGLVVLGGMQQWWLQPIVSSLAPAALFVSALGLTAITDNAALTYLGSLIVGMSDEARYMLMAGAVAGGGLTVIANAPNPAGVALLRRGFEHEAVGMGSLLLGALPPTIVAGGLLFLL